MQGPCVGKGSNCCWYGMGEDYFRGIVVKVTVKTHKWAKFVFMKISSNLSPVDVTKSRTKERPLASTCFSS